MREMPISFTSEMVRAILDRGKSQTRRIINPQPEHLQVHNYRGKRLYDGEHRMWCWRDLILENLWNFPGNEDRRALAARCPFGGPGDRLWVKETYATPFLRTIANNGCIYRADADEFMGESRGAHRWSATSKNHWRNVRFMPKWASRILLEIEEVRAQRLQEISAADALAEGSYLDRCSCMPRARDRAPIHAAFHQTDCHIHGAEFSALWKRIHGSKAWDTPTFVWAISFRRIS